MCGIKVSAAVPKFLAIVVVLSMPHFCRSYAYGAPVQQAAAAHMSSSAKSTSQPKNPGPPSTAASLTKAGDESAGDDKYDDAIAAYTRALAIDPKYVPALNGRSRAEDEAGKADAALADATSALALATAAKDTLDEAIALRYEGNANLSNSHYDVALQLYNQSLQLAKSLNASTVVCNDLGDIGLVYEGQGQHKKALDYEQQAIDLASKTAYVQGQTKWLQNITDIYDALSNNAKSIACYELVLAIDRKNHDVTDQVDVLGNIGWENYKLGNSSKAIAFEQQAIDLATQTGDTDGEHDWIVKLADVYDSQSNYSKSLVCYQRSVELDIKNSNTKDELNDLSDVGSMHEKLGDSAQALIVYKQVISMAAGQDVATRINCLNQLGGAYKRQSQFDAAIDTYQKALDLAVSAGSLTDQDKCLNTIGNIYQDLSNYAKALDYFNRALEAATKSGKMDGIAGDERSVGFMHEKLSQLDLAADCYQKSLDASISAGDEANQIYAWFRLGSINDTNKNYDKSIDCYQKALALGQKNKFDGTIETTLGCIGYETEMSGHLGEALTYYRRAADVAAKGEYAQDELTWRRDVALSYEHLNQMDDAIGAYKQALELATSIGDKNFEATLQADIGRVGGVHPVIVQGPSVDTGPLGKPHQSSALDHSPKLARVALQDLPPNVTSVHVDLRMNVIDQATWPDKVYYTLDVRLTGNCNFADVTVLDERNATNTYVFTAAWHQAPVDGQWHTIPPDDGFPDDNKYASYKPFTIDNLRAYATGIPNISTSTLSADKPTLVPQLGHGSEVYDTSFSPDGATVLSCSFDDSIKIWDRKSRNLLHTFSAGSGVAMSAKYSPDGTRIVSSTETTIQIWDARSAALIHEIVLAPKHGSLHGNPSMVTYSHNGRLIAAASWNGNVYVWDGITFQLLFTLEGHSDKVAAVTFSPDDRTLYSAGWDGTIRLWDTHSGALITTIDAKAGPLYAVALSPDGKTMYTGGEDRLVRIWNIASRAVTKTLTGHSNAVLTLAVSPNGSSIASGGADGKINLWDSTTGACHGTLAAAEFVVRSVAFSRDGKSLVSGGRDANSIWDIGNSGYNTAPTGPPVLFEPVRIWDVGRQKLTAELTGTADYMYSVQVPARSNTLAVTCQNSAFTFDLDQGSRDRGLNGCGSNTCFDPTGAIFTYLTKSNTEIGLWDWRKQAPCGEMKPQSGKIVSNTCWSTDGRFVAFGTDDSHIDICELATKTVVRSFSTGKLTVRRLAWSPNDNIIAGICSDNSIQIWDATTGSPLHDITVKNRMDIPNPVQPACYNIKFSPDGNTLAAVYEDTVIRTFDASTGIQTNIMMGRTDPIADLAYAPDGGLIVAGHRDHTVDCWDAKTGELVRTIFGNDGEVMGLDFDPSQEILATASYDCAVRLWKPDTGALIASIYTFIDGDWAVVAPDGHFDTNNLDLTWQLHWVMPDNTPLPFAVFMRQYYEPRLLPRLIDGEKLPAVPDIASLYRKRPAVTISPIFAKDPTDRNRIIVNVSVSKPTGIPPTGISEVSAQTMSPKPKDNAIWDLRLFRDGQLVGYAPSDADGGVVTVDPKTGSRTIAFPVRVPHDGRKTVTFTAYAFNCDLVKSDTATIDYAIPSPATVPGKAYVISMGVDAYEDPAWDLRYCANDARLINGSLVSRLSTPKRYSQIVAVRLISDSSGHFATKSLFKAVCDILAGHQVNSKVRTAIPNGDQLTKATPEDMVIISFSSHGAADQKGNFYLFPSDIGRGPHTTLDDTLKSHAISSRDLSYWLRDVDAGQMAMIIDACHSSASVEGLDFKPGPMDSRGLGQLAYDKGMRILAASQADNVAVESGRLGDGLLTYALAKDGLDYGQAGAAAADRKITLARWLKYGVVRVPSLYDELMSDEPDPFAAKDAPIHGVIWFKPKSAIQQPSLFDFSKALADPVLASNVIPVRQ